MERKVQLEEHIGSNNVAESVEAEASKLDLVAETRASLQRTPQPIRNTRLLQPWIG